MDFLEIVKNFEKVNALIIGDFILDKYIWGSVSRISPEAPVPIVKVESIEYRPGGAGNVALNMRALGCNVMCIGLAGYDENSKILKKLFDRAGIKARIYRDKRITTVKTRVIAHKQQVVRIDEEEVRYVEGKIQNDIIKFIKDISGGHDVAVISDYAKGLMAPELTKEIISLLRGKVPVVIDPKGDNYNKYTGATIIKPNFNEFKWAVSKLDLTINDIKKFSTSLIDKYELDGLVVTLGENGVFIQKKDGEYKRIPTRAKEVYDVSGAGDTFIGTFSAVFAITGDCFISGEIANLASGIVVGKIGTATVNQFELINEMKNGALKDVT